MGERYEAGSKIKMTIDKIAKLLVIILISVKYAECSVTDDISKRMKILESVSGRYFSDVYQNGTFRTGNVLWDNILNKCTASPSVSCLQKNVYTYLDDKIGMNGDVEVASGMCFKKNNVDINKYSKEANSIYLTGSKDEDRAKSDDFEEDNEIEDDEPGESRINITFLKTVRLVKNHSNNFKWKLIFMDFNIREQ